MDRQELKKIYEDNARAVYKYLFCLTHDAPLSEDLTQETFYQAAKGIDKFRGDCKVSVWLCSIAKHLWYKEIEKRKYDTLPIDEAEDKCDTTDLEENYLLNVEKVELFRLLHELEPQTREVVYLRLTGELSFAEIGDILGISENTARVTFYRGKQKIRKGNENDR